VDAADAQRQPTSPVAALPTAASWADVGIFWTGVWHEDGAEWLFSFHLSENESFPIPPDDED
jgi:hypothetical protein